MSSKQVSVRRAFPILAVFILPLSLLAAFTGFLQARASQPVVSTHSNALDTASVSMVDFEFQPRVITVTVGTSVRWTNNGAFPHTTTSDSGIWDSGDIAPGGMYTVTFNTPGVFPYHCIHHAPVMVGTVVVLGETFLPVITR